jgi:hypothetical protein
MIVPKFTPGPWRAGHINHFERPERIAIRAENVDGQPYIAFVAVGIEEMEANARLIAAGPKLYAAGHALLKALHGYCDMTDLLCEEIEALGTALDAVDEARQGTQGTQGGHAMSKPKFTPGPWMVVPDADGYRKEDAARIVWGSQGPGHGAVCEVSSYSRPSPAANALLIAAGPTMYEYIAKKANEGDTHAAEIIAAADGKDA